MIRRTTSARSLGRVLELAEHLTSIAGRDIWRTPHRLQEDPTFE
jgi:hypothetical protein